jgi:DNA-3-methyladenine glycosylase I
VERIARYGPQDVERLMNDPGIIRNRRKITSAIGNAQAWLRIMEQGPGSFDHFLWKHFDHRPVFNHWTAMQQVPMRSGE